MEPNLVELSKIMDVEKYLEKSKDEYDDSCIEGNIIKVDEDDIFVIYVEEKEFKDLFEIT